MSADVQNLRVDYEYFVLKNGNTHLLHKRIEVSVRVGTHELDIEFLASDGKFSRQVRLEETLWKDNYRHDAIKEAEAELEKLGFEKQENER